MALITSDCGVMRLPERQMALITSGCVLPLCAAAEKWPEDAEMEGHKTYCFERKR